MPGNSIASAPRRPMRHGAQPVISAAIPKRVPGSRQDLRRSTQFCRRLCGDGCHHASYNDVRCALGYPSNQRISRFCQVSRRQLHFPLDHQGSSSPDVAGCLSWIHMRGLMVNSSPNCCFASGGDFFCEVFDHALLPCIAVDPSRDQHRIPSLRISTGVPVRRDSGSRLSVRDASIRICLRLKLGWSVAGD